LVKAASLTSGFGVKIVKGTGISVKETVSDKKETVVQMPMLQELTATP
jgi:hypothetical protein